MARRSPQTAQKRERDQPKRERKEAKKAARNTPEIETEDDPSDVAGDED